ncbi:hypothetical protein [Deinococcus marmoris]|uniref:Uncharacterized protein n=1 Tax=Deinococcus marmoris TaxID=249408 RepID=A0A1U7P5B1_9DEIO|nr:hypothetical protein [Deinococcus marmoris]OLV20346.1 hypothetical protein BOO71_0000094 [Deinococcus marmoris]
MKPFLYLLPLAMLGLTSPALAQAAPNCTLANLVDGETYMALAFNPAQSSAAAESAAATGWADCRAARLRADLKASPNLNTRIDGLRKAYRALRSSEGEMAATRNGGGTLYLNAIPLTYPALETQVQSLAALARSPLGGQTSAAYAAQIKQAMADHAAYVKALRDFKPGKDVTAFDPKAWKSTVDNYEKLSKSVMTTLGTKGDAATALGYHLLNTTTFPATNDGGSNPDGS